uniref:Phosphoacetylglucosamine mutase n=1 Tax=Octactis speculum TaxID=3111310 RepID=A0A7S2CLD8_9STRA
MVTASHNLGPDNGIKMVDADGGMLATSWEAHAQVLANAPCSEAMGVLEGVLATVACGGASIGGILEGGGEKTLAAILSSSGGSVFVARDTRSHSPHLASLAIRGASLFGAASTDFGILTTPVLHHIVRMRNIADPPDGREIIDFGVSPDNARSWASELGYGAMVGSAYRWLVGTAGGAEERLKCLQGDGTMEFNEDVLNERQFATFMESGGGGDRGTLHLDGASGVGALKMPGVVAAVNDGVVGGTLLRLEVRNGVGDGELNESCGAEFVQKERLPPRGFTAEADCGTRLCSFDGDADRLVYHYFPSSGAHWRLLDGDKLATLAADFLKTELDVLGLNEEFSMAVVQTAYANGASTAYLESIGTTLDFAKTGVKFVHHVAEGYDVAVYFEANGHGTVLFKAKVVRRLQNMLNKEMRQEAREAAASWTQTEQDHFERRLIAAQRLLATHQLVNQAVGDAMTDALLVEAILTCRGWGLEEWDSLYADLPSRQSKLPVMDRSVISCSPNETRVLAPPQLQETLDGHMGTVNKGRCFVRPSGTEDVVRIYAEAATQEEADQLAFDAMCAVFDIAGGVGEPPVPFCS